MSTPALEKIPRRGWWRRWVAPDGLCDHARWELILMRVLFAATIWLNLPAQPPIFTSQPIAHGFAKLGWNFTFITSPAIFWPWRGVVMACLIAYALGGGTAWTLGCFVMFQTCVSTLNQSQGFTGHTGQLLALIALAQIAAALWTVGTREGGWKDLLRQRLPMMRRGFWWTAQTIAAAYFVAGVSKMLISGWGWLARAAYFPLQVHKAQGDVYFTHGVEPLPAYRWLTGMLDRFPWLAAVILGAGLVMELTAFALILNRRLAAVYGLAFIAFHVFLDVFMGVPFTQNQRALWIFLVNPVWWVAAAWGWLRARSQTLP